MEQISPTTAPKTALVPDDAVGAMVVYDDPGVWAYTPAKMRTGVIVGVEPSKYHGRYFLVEVEAGKLPKRITEAQVIAFARVNQAALTAIGA